MISRNAKNGIIVKVLSPHGLALISLMVFLSGWLFPPKLYSYYIHEPDYMFLDIGSIIYYLLCVLFFILGANLISKYFSQKYPVGHKIRTRISPLLYILLPLIIGLTFCIASCVLILRDYPLLLAALVSQSGYAIKYSELNEHVPFGLSNIWLLGIIWWAHGRYSQLALGKKSRLLTKIILLAATFACVLASLLKLSRVELMLVVIGATIIFGVKHNGENTIRVRHICFYFLAIACGIVSLFLVFSFLRGVSPEYFIGDIIGYTITSYNRLACLLHQRIKYRYGGQGIYLLNFMAFNNTINRLIPIRSFCKWPSFYDWWQSEFVSVGNAGLNDQFIWAGSFGYIFADVGWFAPLIIFVYGIITGLAWRAIKMGRAFGLTLYPWLAFSVLFWFGTNNIVENKGFVLILEALMLVSYERLLIIKSV
jgi:hypothetical protein